MEKIGLIKEAIRKGVHHDSKLTDEQFKVGGFTSPNIRHIMNNIGAISKQYFEVGAHIGCSLIMNTFGNDHLQPSVTAENWAEFNNGGTTRDDFFKNCEANIPGRYKIIEKNCFKITKEELPEGIDYFFYDGAHDLASQCEGITHFAPMLADEFILLVDDFAWPDPRNGTYNGIKESGLKVIWETFLFDGIEGGAYWNGLGIFLLKK